MVHYNNVCRGSGRIVDIYAANFEALSGNGEIGVEVENTGEVTAAFSVSPRTITNYCLVII